MQRYTIVLSYRFTVRLGLSEHLLQKQKQIMEKEGETHVIITWAKRAEGPAPSDMPQRDPRHAVRGRAREELQHAGGAPGAPAPRRFHHVVSRKAACGAAFST